MNPIKYKRGEKCVFLTNDFKQTVEAKLRPDTKEKLNGSKICYVENGSWTIGGSSGDYFSRHDTRVWTQDIKNVIQRHDGDDKYFSGTRIQLFSDNFATTEIKGLMGSHTIDSDGNVVIQSPGIHSYHPQYMSCEYLLGFEYNCSGEVPSNPILYYDEQCIRISETTKSEVINLIEKESRKQSQMVLNFVDVVKNDQAIPALLMGISNYIGLIDSNPTQQNA